MFSHSVYLNKYTVHPSARITYTFHTSRHNMCFDPQNGIRFVT